MEQKFNQQDNTISIAIPTEVENLKLPDPSLLMYYNDLSDRVIWVDYDVTETIHNVSRSIIEFNKQDRDIPPEERKPIKLLLYSYGGDGQACYSLLDIIALSKTPVYTYNMGVSMSAGLLILLAGHKRFCLEHSIALAHSGSGSVSGSFEQTEAQMQDYQHFVQEMRNYILKRTAIDQKTLNKYKNKEWYLYAEDQIKYKIVDEIVTSIDILC